MHLFRDPPGARQTHLGVRWGKRGDSPVDLPERVAPAECAMLVEPRDVESGGEGLDAIEFPWSTVLLTPIDMACEKP